MAITLPAIAGNSLTVRATTGKNGKSSETQLRAARALSGASQLMVQSLAVHGKTAATRKTAAAALGLLTFDELLSVPAIDGGQWPDVYAAFADQFGYKIQGSQGKRACRDLVAYAAKTIQLRELVAETDGLTDAQYRRLMADRDNVNAAAAALDAWQAAADKLAAAADKLAADTLAESGL